MTNKGTQDKYFTVFFFIFVGMRASVMYNSGQKQMSQKL